MKKVIKSKAKTEAPRPARPEGLLSAYHRGQDELRAIERKLGTVKTTNVYIGGSQ